MVQHVFVSDNIHAVLAVRSSPCVAVAGAAGASAKGVLGTAEAGLTLTATGLVTGLKGTAKAGLTVAKGTAGLTAAVAKGAVKGAAAVARGTADAAHLLAGDRDSSAAPPPLASSRWPELEASPSKWSTQALALALGFREVKPEEIPPIGALACEIVEGFALPISDMLSSDPYCVATLTGSVPFCSRQRCAQAFAEQCPILWHPCLALLLRVYVHVCEVVFVVQVLEERGGMAPGDEERDHHTAAPSDSVPNVAAQAHVPGAPVGRGAAARVFRQGLSDRERSEIFLARPPFLSWRELEHSTQLVDSTRVFFPNSVCIGSEEELYF